MTEIISKYKSTFASVKVGTKLSTYVAEPFTGLFDATGSV